MISLRKCFLGRNPDISRCIYIHVRTYVCVCVLDVYLCVHADRQVLDWTPTCSHQAHTSFRSRMPISTPWGMEIMSPSPHIFWITHANFHPMGYGNNLNMINLSLSLSLSHLLNHANFHPMGYGNNLNMINLSPSLSLSLSMLTTQMSIGDKFKTHAFHLLLESYCSSTIIIYTAIYRKKDKLSIFLPL